MVTCCVWGLFVGFDGVSVIWTAAGCEVLGRAAKGFLTLHVDGSARLDQAERASEKKNYLQSNLSLRPPDKSDHLKIADTQFESLRFAD